MVSLLEQIFPGLTTANYQVTSPPDRDYNCIAWAAGDNRKWWWPGPDPEREYWPPGVPRDRTRTAFVAAFASFGSVSISARLYCSNSVSIVDGRRTFLS